MVSFVSYLSFSFLFIASSLFVANLNVSVANTVKIRKVSIKDQKNKDFYAKRQLDHRNILIHDDQPDTDLNQNNNNSKVTPYISQLKKMRSLSKSTIEKIKKQNEKQRENLAECYQQIGRYNRLIVANNARNETNQIENIFNNQNNKKVDKNMTKMNLNSRIFIYNELSFYLLVIIFLIEFESNFFNFSSIKI
jgi:galactose-1-phosphate uridylyltransferase